MKALRGWGGVARTSLDPPQEPHYRDEVEGPSPVQDKVPRCELGGLQPSTRSTRRCDGVVVRGGDRCLDARPERPAGRAAAVLGSRDRDRPDPATPVRLEFPILSLHPGLRPRGVAPDVWGRRVAGGGAAALVEEAGRPAGRLPGGAPRRAPAADGDAVAVEDPRAIGITARPRRAQPPIGC